VIFINYVTHNKSIFLSFVTQSLSKDLVQIDSIKKLVRVSRENYN
jgi:hypothetical protein